MCSAEYLSLIDGVKGISVKANANAKDLTAKTKAKVKDLPVKAKYMKRVV